MKIERERGISVVTSVMTFEYERQRLQPARHARPRGFRRRHLPHAVGGRLRRHGHRRRQGHRAAHAETVRSLPAARHPDHHLHQQDGPRKPRPLRDPRRDRAEAGAGHRADHLADRPRQDLFRHLPSGAERGAPRRRRDRSARRSTGRIPTASPACCRKTSARPSSRSWSWRARPAGRSTSRPSARAI